MNVLPLPWVEGQPVVSLEGERLLQVEVAYDELGEKEITSRTFEQLVRIQATQNPNEVKHKAEIIPWVAMQRAGQVIDEITRHMDVGRADLATAALQNVIASLKEYGPDAPVREAVQQLEALLQRIQADEWSGRERKSSKYRSHSYRKMSSRELWTAPEPPPSFKAPPQSSPPPPTDPAAPSAGSPV